MLFDLRPSVLISNAIALLVAMTVHEFAHAYVAYLMGDNTAKEQNRMTLDPRANINLPGYILGVVIGFGILGSAPINPYRMRDPRWGMFWAVLAGPVSNLVVAAAFALPFMLGLMEPAFDPGSVLLPSPGFLIQRMVWLNILLFVFNLLPFYPLDGWTIVLAVLPARQSAWWERNRQYNMIVGIALLALSWVGPSAGIPFDPLSFLIFEPSSIIARFLFSPLF